MQHISCPYSPHLQGEAVAQQVEEAVSLGALVGPQELVLRRGEGWFEGEWQLELLTGTRAWASKNSLQKGTAGLREMEA